MGPPHDSGDITNYNHQNHMRNGNHIFNGTRPITETNPDTFDVIVVGGGAAGIGAAIGAKQANRNSRVIIVESEGCPGGAATHRGVLSYCGLYSVEEHPRRAVGQIWNELHCRLVRERAASELPDRIVAYVQVLCSFSHKV
jgi:hypothetical protein